jgi:hypothetical protein
MWLAPENWYSKYFSIVDKALVDELVFSQFKSSPDYKCIVGMSFPWQADVWIEYLNKYRPEILENIHKYSLNDTIGNPEYVRILSNTIISPSTLRYLNTAIEIETFFKFDKKIKVCELGVGYGGLSYIMNCHFDIESYCLIDTDNVQKLAKKYLDRLGISTHTTEFQKPVDLFISEFCLSEFDDLDLYKFYEDYILNSENVYLSMNLHDEERKQKFLDRISQDFNIEISDEFPKTQWPNYIIKGSKK